MPVRIFLGYDSTFLPNLVSHLLADRESLAETLIIVPTGQSGRMLRESLAAEAEAILAPAVTTPGALLRIEDPGIAPTWLEKLVWIETLESISTSDWQDYAGLFPVSPVAGDGSSDWAVSLASELVALRADLQENRHNLFSASKFMASTPEAERWQDLARLEALAEKRLASLGYSSRSSKLREGFRLPAGHRKIILAGITELPPCLKEALENFPGEVTALIAAPEGESSDFSPHGIPLDSWVTREIPSHTKVDIEADPPAQARCALNAVSSTGSPSPEIALGSPDEQTGAAVARVFTENGWCAFHPASPQPLPPIVRWLEAWKKWLTKPSSQHLAALMSLPESSALINGKRAQKLMTLNRLRDWQPTIEPDEILRRIESKEDAQKSDLHAAITSLREMRENFLSSPFPKVISDLLNRLQTGGGDHSEIVTRIEDFISTAEPIFRKANRSHIFWLQTLLSEIPRPVAQPPIGRVIDVQGWLELLFEPGKHLVICGMNDTFVPARSGSSPLLSESSRKILGLNSDAGRHSRDSYLLHAMLMMREKSGSAHLICGKNGAGGEPYLPSRLLLHVPRPNLVNTVRNLFREIEPPEADLIWSRDWTWQTPNIKLPDHFGVTSLRDYLNCPFRFYLKHLVRMSTPDPDRREMNARDFGNITHFVVENWGNDPDARKLTDPSKLSAYLDHALDAVVFKEFGKKPPLAIRIQVQAIRQRLEWFAHRQAESAADGWEVIAVERVFAIPSGDFLIKGKIDRIDRHRETGQLRVIDYKTGDVKKDVEQEHRSKVVASSRIPAHITQEDPPFHKGTDPKGKPADFIWRNLQLPLYALAESLDSASSSETPIPCYIHLGKTEANVKFTTWDSFSTAELASAQACAGWISSEISQRKFWPPAEKVNYDDFAFLSQNRPLAEAFSATLLSHPAGAEPPG